MSSDDDVLLAEQMAYYRAAAAEYDRPYAEREELRRLPAVVDGLPVGEDVLELACGTGQWTVRLAARAGSVTAVDAAAEVLAIARRRAPFPNVRFLQADLFTWRPSRRYDHGVLRLLALPRSTDAVVRVLERRCRHARTRRKSDLRG